MAFSTVNTIFFWVGQFSIKCIYYFIKVLKIVRWTQNMPILLSGVQCPLKPIHLIIIIPLEDFINPLQGVFGIQSEELSLQITNSVKVLAVKDNRKSADPWPLTRPLAVVHLVCTRKLYVLYLIYLMHIYKYIYYYCLILRIYIIIIGIYWFVVVFCYIFSIQMILIWFFFTKTAWCDNW